jgi:hypothetical protein
MNTDIFKVEKPRDNARPAPDPAKRARTPPSPDDYSLHQLDAAQSDMQAVLDAYPALTPSGFNVNPRPIAIPRSVDGLARQPP